MSIQISIKLSDLMFRTAKKHVKDYGFDSLQNFIRETLRRELFEDDEEITGMQLALASEPSLAKDWLTPEEDEAWAHLQEKK